MTYSLSFVIKFWVDGVFTYRFFLTPLWIKHCLLTFMPKSYLFDCPFDLSLTAFVKVQRLVAHRALGNHLDIIIYLFIRQIPFQVVRIVIDLCQCVMITLFANDGFAGPTFRNIQLCWNHVTGFAQNWINIFISFYNILRCNHPRILISDAYALGQLFLANAKMILFHLRLKNNFQNFIMVCLLNLILKAV